MPRTTHLHFAGALVALLVFPDVALSQYTIPSTAPSTAKSVDPALLSVSIEFFTFPDYAGFTTTTNCLANLQQSRGTAPAVRIGGTTQDRATYNASDPSAVTYTVASPVDAPASLTYGPSFFNLAAQLRGDVTIGLNRQLNNENNTLAAAVKAKSVMKNLLSIELGNEPDFYAAGSPIIPAGQSWSPDADGANENKWFTDLGPTLGSVFQGGVYFTFPGWSISGLIPKLTTGAKYVKTFSRHSYPQSACGGAATNLTALMYHPSTVQYTSKYGSEAAAVHSSSKRYFFGETNSATCGGGGISPTFGAALWIADYTLQAALQGVERLYFHQGTIAACPYCWWNGTTVNAPFYGAAFTAEALGSATTNVSQLDSGTSPIAVYAFYNASGKAIRLLLINSMYYGGSGTRPSTQVTFKGVTGSTARQAKRLTSASALSQVGLGQKVTIGGASFSGTCQITGTSSFESVPVSSGAIAVTLLASEALYIIL